MWFLFASLAGLFYTGSGLLTRYVLKEKKDAWAFSFYFSAVGTVVSFPFALIHFQIPSFTSLHLWFFLVTMGSLIVVHNYLNFKSANFLPASLNGSITKFRLLWVLFFAIIFSGETVTIRKIIAVCATILAGVIIVHGFKKTDSLKGIIFAFLATIVYAIVVTIVKFLLTFFSSSTITFFIFLIPTILNFLSMPQAKKRIKKIFLEDGKFTFVACLLGGLANLAMNQAYSLGDASRVVVAMESFLILTLAGEHIVLKEKAKIGVKIIAVGLALIAVFLIQ